MEVVHYCILQALIGKDSDQHVNTGVHSKPWQYPEAQRRDLENILTSKKPVYTRTGK